MRRARPNSAFASASVTGLLNSSACRNTWCAFITNSLVCWTCSGLWRALENSAFCVSRDTPLSPLGRRQDREDRHTQDTHRHTHKTHTQTHTDTHRHTQTHTDTHRHTQTHTHTQRQRDRDRHKMDCAFGLHLFGWLVWGHLRTSCWLKSSSSPCQAGQTCLCPADT